MSNTTTPLTQAEVSDAGLDVEFEVSVGAFEGAPVIQVRFGGWERHLAAKEVAWMVHQLVDAVAECGSELEPLRWRSNLDSERSGVREGVNSKPE